MYISAHTIIIIVFIDKPQYKLQGKWAVCLNTIINHGENNYLSINKRINMRRFEYLKNVRRFIISLRLTPVVHIHELVV